MPHVNGMGLLYRLRDIAPQIPMAMIGMPKDETREELRALQIEELVRRLLANRGRVWSTQHGNQSAASPN